MIKNQILEAITRKSLPITPMEHCPDGNFEDYDHWDSVNVAGKEYDINFSSDGTCFYITAYPLEMGDDGYYHRTEEHYTNVKVYELPA